jgi:two-component system, LuxR family, sensor kinase FixL
MTNVSYDQTRLWTGTTSQTLSMLRLLRLAVIVGLAYYVGARIGFALTLKPSPVSTLWPPNSILLAAFLLTPVRSWWAILLGAFVAHLAVQLELGIPLPMVLGWFVSNSSEGLIGASLVRHFVKGPLHFESFREVAVFLVAAVLLGTCLSSFLDAGFVTMAGMASGGYWDIWSTRTASNVLAELTLVPVIVTWINGGSSAFRAAPRRYLEAVILGLGLLAVCILAFGGRSTPDPVLLYAPLPFLAWAAVRFGPRGTSACLLFVTALAIWGAVKGHGPFLTRSPAENALSIQLFLTVFSIPLLTQAAVMQEMKRAEASARESQEQLNLALCASQIETLEWHIANDAWSMSPASRKFLGLDDSKESVNLNDFIGAVHPEDRAAVTQVVRESVEHGSPYECEFRTVPRDGRVRWVLSKGEIIYDNAGDAERLVAVNVDITERKFAEKLRQEDATLRESEARFHELADTSPVLVWQAGPDRLCNFFNKTWLEFTGRTLQQELGNGWAEGVHPDDLQRCLAKYYVSFEARRPFTMEYRLLRADGEYRWVLDNGVPHYTPAGEFEGYIGSCIDVTSQKQGEQALREAQLELEARVSERTQELSSAIVALQGEIAERAAAERALRSSEERFGKAFHSSPDAIVIVRQSDYRIIEVNKKWEAMFGYTRAEALGRTSEDLGLVVHDEDRRQIRSLLEAQGVLPEFELDARSRAGEILRIVLVTDTLDMAGEPCHIITIRDLTERKRAESMLLQQRRELAHLNRVAALGELSGALAHELNQPLAAMLANARAAQRIMSADRPDMAELRDIMEDIAFDDRRAGQVIARLQGMLKKGDLQVRPVKMEDIVYEVLSLLHSDLIQRRVSATTQLAAGLPPVLGDRVQLQQVLLNLMLNACDAMADRPTADRRMTITTRLAEAGGIQLSVYDRGGGIPEGRLDQIFDPFVTTKKDGLGLGLAICRSIITAHGGRLWAVNNEDAGATFTVELKPMDVDGATPSATVMDAIGAEAELKPPGSR